MRPEETRGEQRARTSPLPLERVTGKEPLAAWKVLALIVLFFWGCMHAAFDLRWFVEVVLGL